MTVLDVVDLSFGYTNDVLFDSVSFRLNLGDRAALVAPNGAGKSTLLRIIAGEIAPDRGSVVVPKGTTTGYYRQSHEIQVHGSVLDVLLSGFTEIVQLREELIAAQHAAASGSARALDHLADITERYQRVDGDALERRVEMIATHLGFRLSDLDRDVKTLSGGERGRLSLGAVLATEPKLLMLDEPTNHLDLQTIKWLESHLRGWAGTLLIVSHDRAFLDAVCPNTFELGKTQLRSYPVPYSEYHELRAEDLARERKLAEEQAAFVEKTEDFIRRNMAGQKTKQAQSRRKMLDKLERIENPEDVWARAEKVRFRFADAPRSGDIVLDASGLRAERGQQVLFSGLDLLVRRGDRVGVVGANGCGKSTLLKLLAGFAQAEDKGTVKRGTNLREGYFDQHLGSLDPNKSCVDEVRSVRGDLNLDGARQYLARFRFYADDPLRKVGSLSGGERTRLALAKLLLEPRNLLFLDEPTNHLDIPAGEILEEALVGFEGTVVLVSHDRRFLENVTTRTVAFKTEGVDIYEGGFKDYSEAEARRERALLQQTAAQPPAKANKRVEKAPPAAAPPAADAYKTRRTKDREQERKTRRLQQLEKELQAAETALEDYRTKLRAATTSNWEQLHGWAEREQELSRAAETLMKEWVALSEELACPN